MKMSIPLAVLSILAILALGRGIAAAACQDSVQEARTSYSDVSEKVKKMKRLHKARQMMSMEAVSGLDKDLGTIKVLVDEAKSLCDRKQDGPSTKKSNEAIALAKDVDKRHVELMKMGQSEKQMGQSEKKMKH